MRKNKSYDLQQANPAAGHRYSAPQCHVLQLGGNSLLTGSPFKGNAGTTQDSSGEWEEEEDDN